MTLIRHLDEQSQTCTALLTLLQQECELLKQRERTQIEQLTRDKIPLITRLEAGRQTRQQWLRALGLTADQPHWEQLLNQHGGQKLLEDWQNLQARFSDCQRQNDINGRLVARGKQSLHRLLQVVRGQGDAPKLYTAGGRTRAQLSQRSFVKA